MTSNPDILAPYLVHFTTKPNDIESVQIYEKCLNDIQIDFTERLAWLRNQLDDVSVFVRTFSPSRAAFYHHTQNLRFSSANKILNKYIYVCTNKIAFCRFEPKVYA